MLITDINKGLLRIRPPRQKMESNSHAILSQSIAVDDKVQGRNNVDMDCI